MDALSLFNQQVLQCQDEAYSLAWYLLGDEVQAETETQAAIASAFRHAASSRENYRLLIFKQVVTRCRGRQPNPSVLAGQGILHPLHLLSEPERLASVLIDIFALNYSVAAWVVDLPVKEIIRVLTHARRKLSYTKELKYAA